MSQPDINILQLNGGVNGTVHGTDIYPAVDTTDFSQAPDGTTKRYSIAQLTTYINGQANVLTYNLVTGTTQAIVENNGYVTSNVAQTVFTLPTVAAFGNIFRIVGYGSGGWIVNQNALQQIIIGSSSTTIGGGGAIQSTNQNDGGEFLCIVANTTFIAISLMGNITLI